MVQDTAINHARRIGTRMRSIEWCHYGSTENGGPKNGGPKR